MAKGFLKTKHGPLTGTGWLAAAGGILASWLVIRRYSASRAAAAQRSATTDLSGGTIPAGQAAGTPTGGTTAATPPAPTDLASWTSMALKYAPHNDPIAALNSIQQWMSGNCVSHDGYVGIANALRHLGLPPYMESFPVLQVCPQSAPAASPTTTAAPPTGSTTPPAPAPIAAPPPPFVSPWHPVPPTVIPTRPEPTQPNTVTPNPSTFPGSPLQLLRDLTLILQANSANANHDATAFWANFGALTRDYQAHAGLADEIEAYRKTLPASSPLYLPS